MSKNNFLLVNLSDKKTKKVAETITSDTSRKILDHLANGEDSQEKIAKKLKLPKSTVHYHLEKLQEAGLVLVDTFHYSKRGKEINHYKLANKYIIIAPKKVSGLKKALKGILPIGMIAVGISAVVKIMEEFVFKTKQVVYNSADFIVDQKTGQVVDKMGNVVDYSAYMSMDKAGQLAVDHAANKIQPDAMYVSASSEPNIAIYFFLGVVMVLGVYVAYVLIRWWLKKREE